MKALDDIPRPPGLEPTVMESSVDESPRMRFLKMIGATGSSPNTSGSKSAAVSDQDIQLPQVEQRLPHHMNFNGDWVYERSETPPEVSFFAICTTRFKQLVESGRSIQGRVHLKTVLTAQAFKFVDPVQYQGGDYDQPVDEHGIYLTGTRLRDHVTGRVEVAYSKQGTWVQDHYASDDNVPFPVEDGDLFHHGGLPQYVSQKRSFFVTEEDWQEMLLPPVNSKLKPLTLKATSPLRQEVRFETGAEGPGSDPDGVDQGEKATSDQGDYVNILERVINNIGSKSTKRVSTSEGGAAENPHSANVNDEISEYGFSDMYDESNDDGQSDEVLPTPGESIPADESRIDEPSSSRPGTADEDLDFEQGNCSIIEDSNLPLPMTSLRGSGRNIDSDKMLSSCSGFDDPSLAPDSGCCDIDATGLSVINEDGHESQSIRSVAEDSQVGESYGIPNNVELTECDIAPNERTTAIDVHILTDPSTNLTVDTGVRIQQVQPVTHEPIHRHTHHVREEQLTREIHCHHTVHRIVPVIDTSSIPNEHSRQVAHMGDKTGEKSQHDLSTQTVAGAPEEGNIHLELGPHSPEANDASRHDQGRAEDPEQISLPQPQPRSAKMPLICMAESQSEGDAWTSDDETETGAHHSDTNLSPVGRSLFERVTYPAERHHSDKVLTSQTANTLAEDVGLDSWVTDEHDADSSVPSVRRSLFEPATYPVRSKQHKDRSGSGRTIPTSDDVAGDLWVTEDEDDALEHPEALQANQASISQNAESRVNHNELDDDEWITDNENETAGELGEQTLNESLVQEIP